MSKGKDMTGIWTSPSITVRWLGPTDNRGTRFTAKVADHTFTVSRDVSINYQTQMVAHAVFVAGKMNWDMTPFASCWSGKDASSLTVLFS